eukprot:TRINITY_DN3598_c0_g1_i1.p1 TRINITY_DN3598_c0_g1~~TRINITY_DN3598_c0_g1_i1.p1  ORF type:complete len:672 (+),score=132.82 TRINITY_DN3598_c0_g1_i1:49-2064(+)
MTDFVRGEARAKEEQVIPWRVLPVISSNAGHNQSRGRPPVVQSPNEMLPQPRRKGTSRPTTPSSTISSATAGAEGFVDLGHPSRSNKTPSRNTRTQIVNPPMSRQSPTPTMQSHKHHPSPSTITSESALSSTDLQSSDSHPMQSLNHRHGSRNHTRSQPSVSPAPMQSQPFANYNPLTAHTVVDPSSSPMPGGQHFAMPYGNMMQMPMQMPMFANPMQMNVDLGAQNTVALQLQLQMQMQMLQAQMDALRSATPDLSTQPYPTPISQAYQLQSQLQPQLQSQIQPQLQPQLHPEAQNFTSYLPSTAGDPTRYPPAAHHQASATGISTNTNTNTNPSAQNPLRPSSPRLTPIAASSKTSLPSQQPRDLEAKRTQLPTNPSTPVLGDPRRGSTLLPLQSTANPQTAALHSSIQSTIHSSSDRGSGWHMSSDSDSGIEISQHFIFPAPSNATQLQPIRTSVSDANRFNPPSNHSSMQDSTKTMSDMSDTEDKQMMISAPASAHGFAPARQTSTPKLRQAPSMNAALAHVQLDPNPATIHETSKPHGHDIGNFIAPLPPTRHTSLGFVESKDNESIVVEPRKLLPCPYEGCGKSFQRPDHLRKHILTHTGEKPFVCHHCQKAFSRMDKLKDHLQTHLNGQDHPCPHCNQSFLKKRLLGEHITSVHGHGTIFEMYN